MKTALIALIIFLLTSIIVIGMSNDALETAGPVLGKMAGMYFVLFLYFIPAIIAGSRKHQQSLAVFMLNLTLGWTFLGWLLALIWSCTEVRRPATS